MEQTNSAPPAHSSLLGYEDLLSVLPHMIFLIFVLFPSFFLLMKGFPLFRKTQKKHLEHRVLGFLFLTINFVAWLLFYFDFDTYVSSKIGLCVGFNGFLMAVSAAYSFPFLPDSETPGSFFGDKGLISKTFVRENIFFQLLTCFGFVYYDPDGNRLLKTTFLGNLIEALIIFLPYVLIRPYFPTTRFRSANANLQKVSSLENQKFYAIGIAVIKLFYLGSKHFVGHGLNYLIFLDLLPFKENQAFLNGLVLANGGTVSMAIFLHTLKFKKLLSPRWSYIIYVMMAYAPFLAVLKLAPFFLEFFWVSVIVVVGMFLNFKPKPYWAAWQFLVCLYFFQQRFSEVK